MSLLRLRYVIVGIIMGFILLGVFLFTLPDDLLTIVVCDVGQGDAIYIRFPGNRDMLIDGGPNTAVLSCLGRYMPFWDRQIDIVVITHPEKDHFGGVIDILRRYRVGYLIKTDSDAISESYSTLFSEAANRNVIIRTAHAGDRLQIGPVRLLWLWPEQSFIDRWKQTNGSTDEAIAASGIGYNDTSQVFHLRFGTFDALFTGDAGTSVERGYVGTPLTVDKIELLKVPHHGSKTGMTPEFLTWLNPVVAVISNAKNNSYGHPSPVTLNLLKEADVAIFRTDTDGDIVIKTDGKTYRVTK